MPVECQEMKEDSEPTGDQKGESCNDERGKITEIMAGEAHLEA
jgi:hypothetical protein